MKVLIFGGTGAMGTPLVEFLANSGNNVFITSRKARQSSGNIHYITGNAHDFEFVKKLVCEQRFDAIVDFMVYTTKEFKQRADMLLKATDHYLFLSSSRVYADSDSPITENSPRLLDVSKDSEYLQTDEYALAKARQENILFTSTNKNWTIIRPYITYNIERLQLATLEKDIWLRRALEGHKILLPQDVAVHKTTMTYDDDVARAISLLIGNEKAKAEAVHLTSTEPMTWKTVLKIYTDVIETKFGVSPEIWMPETSDVIADAIGNKYQIRYDRMFDRVFDNSKMLELCGKDFAFLSMEIGLRKCLEKFLVSPRWIDVDSTWVARLDRAEKCTHTLKDFETPQQKMKYIGWRYCPTGMTVLKKVVHKLK